MLDKLSARAVEAFKARGLPRKIEAKAAVGGAKAEILIYDVIGDDGWGGGMGAQAFKAALDTVGASDPINVRINSPGGSAFDGVAIYNMMKARGNITVTVEGIAASAASIIAMGGDRLEMPEASMLMIHNAWTLAVGNKKDLQQTVDALAKLDGVMAGVYAAKSGKTAEEMAAFMDSETYFTGAKAKEAGLADVVLTAPKKTTTKAEIVEPVAAVEPVAEAPAPANEEKTRRRAILARKLLLALAS